MECGSSCLRQVNKKPAFIARQPFCDNQSCSGNDDRLAFVTRPSQICLILRGPGSVIQPQMLMLECSSKRHPYSFNPLIHSASLIVTQSNDDAQHNRLSTTHICHANDFHCRHHFCSDNKQPYNHGIKLPEARFAVIRFFPYLQVSGSVPRTRNKQSGNIGRWAAGHDQGAEYNI